MSKRLFNLIKVTAFYSLTFVFIALVSGFVGEVFLRVFWSNPYSMQPLALDYAGFIRLQLPKVNVQYDVTGLYPGRSVVRFRTADDGHVLSEQPSSGPIVYFYGGSTTESRYVPEGSRWPEIIPRIDGRNWGVSGNHLLDSYLNFKFHLERMPPPKYAVFMHAVNDFSARNVFDIEQYIKTMGQRRSNQRTGARVYLFDFGMNLYSIWFGVSNVKEKIRQTSSISNYKFMDEQGYQEFLRNRIKPFLENRTKILTSLLRLAESKKITMVLITQPHAYGSNYIPRSEEDFRTLPAVDDGYFLSFKQMGQILDLINENTRNFAKLNQVSLIDASSVFDTQDVSEFFYDGVHYTERGSLALGRIVSSAAPWN